MELTIEQTKKISKALEDPRAIGRAPKVVMMAVASLMPEGEEISSCVCVRADSGDRWHVLAVTQSRLLFVEASHPTDTDWDLGSHAGDNASIAGRSWARSQVERQEVRGVADNPDTFQSDWRWMPELWLVMRDGTEIPVSGQGIRWNMRVNELAEALVKELQQTP